MKATTLCKKLNEKYPTAKAVIYDDLVLFNYWGVHHNTELKSFCENNGFNITETEPGLFVAY
tara:strand:- start:377 stop:562 length:186 start_codon:yes stop_codon:yes gene_type:complete